MLGSRRMKGSHSSFFPFFMPTCQQDTNENLDWLRPKGSFARGAAYGSKGLAHVNRVLPAKRAARVLDSLRDRHEASLQERSVAAFLLGGGPIELDENGPQ